MGMPKQYGLKQAAKMEHDNKVKQANAKALAEMSKRVRNA